jgi:DNA-binding transcriptional LysR family regulator
MNRYTAFLKVVEVGSFTKEAVILGYTQPAMSQMIASPENELSIAAKTFIRFLIKNADALP